MGDGEKKVMDAHVFLEPEVQAARVTRLEKAVFAPEDKAREENFAGRH